MICKNSEANYINMIKIDEIKIFTQSILPMPMVLFVFLCELKLLYRMDWASENFNRMFSTDLYRPIVELQ